jgi:hypothetical protein
MLLLAGLGVGAFLLFANKSSATSTAASGGDYPVPGDIPDAPKILAVNSNSTESPLPTGIVSDEEGMETTSSGAYNPARPSSSSSSANNSSNDYGDQSQGDEIPPLISTKLTEKEKTIINKGVLSDELAIKRPDLYKAIHIRKARQKGNGAKALQAAQAAIKKIQLKVKGKVKGKTKAVPKKKRKVTIKLNPNTRTMVQKAATTGAQVAAMAAGNPLSAMAAMASRTAPAKATPTRPPTKGAQPRKKVVRQAAIRRPAAKQPAAKPSGVKRPPAKKPVVKGRAPVARKVAPRKNH